MNPTTLQQKEKFSQFIWTGFILSFFLVQATVWAFAISITSGDTSHAVVDGYDEQALNWDANKTEQKVSENLGWNVSLHTGASADIKGNRKVSVAVTGKDNGPLEDAKVELRAFHCGRARDVQQIMLSETNPGVYEANFRARHPGQWQFDGTVIHNGNRFFVDRRIFVANAGDQ